MSAGNAGAAIGLANSNKVPYIGAYAQTGTPPPGPEAAVNYVGINGSTYYNRNVVDELVDPAFTTLANSGAAAGKLAHWVTTDAAPMTVAADGLCDVSAAGVVTALASTGTYKTYVPPGTVIPAGSYLWVFEV